MTNLSSKVVCITGTLPVPRQIAAEMIAANGGVFAPRVTKNTDVLVVGIFPQGRLSTAKYEAAHKWIEQGYHIALISPEEFLASIEN